ncbi:MAG: leucine-rich repeat domain-containing protein, partial [Clostridia bacterium]|nr:leucine-rich repeat domain-containing protein [Clostridia bacterium]
CPLYDVDGNPLAWYVKSVAEDGKKTYGYVSAAYFDTANPPSERIDFISTGGNANELNNFYVTVGDVTYDKSTLVVLNMRNAKITGGGKNRDGNDASFPYNILSDSKNLEYLYLNLNTSSIGQTAFRSCPNLKYVNFDELTNLKSIGQQSFINCTRLYENRVLDFTNTQLERTEVNSLRGCATTEFIFPETFVSAGQETFKDCKYVTKITFLGELTYISTTYTFENCEKLTTVIGTGTVFASITSIGDYMFKNCKVIKNVDGMIVDGKLTIPSSVGSLAKEPFYGCKSLVSADLGQITSTNYNAFRDCTSLEEVIIPNTLTSMGDTNFLGCTSLKYVKIPNSVTSIGYGAFLGCTALEFAEVSNAVLVRDQIFSGCTSLKAISIPEGVTTIEARAFNGCTSLKAVYLPSTITSIGANSGWGYGAFNGCSNLYFVSEPFEVKDESGNWLGDSFVMPSEPAVYYMPKKLASINGNDFAYCEQINSCLVFPSTFTKISTENGPFINNGKNNKKGGITVVFLGKMTEFCYATQDGRSNNITFVFANPENTGIASLTKWYLPQTHKPSNCYAYFCAGKVSYDLSSFGPSSSGYTASETDFAKTTYTEQTQPHFQNPNGATSRDANCLEKASTFKTCFCGKEYDVVIDETSTALGHIYNLDSITA